MDKKNVRVYTVYQDSITVINGEATECCVKKDVVVKENENFYKALKKVMIEMALKKPYAFQAMYKTLLMSTPEYKLAKKLYKKYNIRAKISSDCTTISQV